MNLLRSVPVVLVLLVVVPSSGQIAFGGEPLGTRAEKLDLPPAPLVELPAVDAAGLLLEDLEREASGIKGLWRFGFNHTTDLTTGNSGVWHTFANGDRLWRIAIRCPGALSINFEFSTYVVPEGAQVFAWNERKEHLGAFTAASAAGRTELGVAQLAGERITIEYHEPAAVSGQGQLRIGQVTHAYRDPLGALKDLGDSGPCNNNVICPEGDDWRDPIASVAMIIAGGNSICTGQLINNCASDGTPYFLTAKHCTPGGVGTWVFRFNWESPACTPTTGGPIGETVSGSSLLASSATSDVALLQLNSTPPASYEVYYSGWDATGDLPPAQTCIHHPNGDVKKISFDQQGAGQATWSGAQCWHIFNWDDGTTEQGSSGSGLWNEDHRLIGQLFGGIASCSNNVDDYFGRFDISYPLLDDWLGDCGPTLDGYDPNVVPVALDATVQYIGNMQVNYCNATSIEPVVTIKNLGTTTLTSLDLLHHLDAAPNSTYTWTGSLITGATATISLGALAVGPGDHTLTVTSDDPNGGTDLNPANDTKTKAFNVTTPGQIITLRIILDDFPEETTWQLHAPGGSVVAQGGPYGGEPDGDTLTVPLCVGNGCYDLTFFDSAGDGICCSYGTGSFSVYDPFGLTYVANNGQFDDEVTETFCVTNTGVADLTDDAAMQVWPNPADGTIQVLVPHAKEVVQLRIIDASGRLVRGSMHRGGTPIILDVQDLGEGVYAIESVSEGARAVRRFVVRH